MVIPLSEDEGVKSFEYIWVLRCSGTNVNRNVEYRLTPQAPADGIRPLIEVVDVGIFRRFATSLRRKYGEILVDFPLYLLESSNKFFESIQELSRRYSNQTSFFQSFQSLIDIPVVSASQMGILDYNAERSILQNMKQHFERLAVRVRVPTFDLSRAQTILGSYQSLLATMTEADLLLFDVFSMSGVENQINLNLELMSRLGKEKNLELFVLNAFEPFDLRHNYGPIFSYRYDLNGFGDLATEKRFPPAGGRAQRRIIRYYYWDRYMLKEIARTNYHLAALQLRNSPYWANHAHHIPSCNVCGEVNNNRYNEGHSYWKRFRMLHYLNSITNETRKQFTLATSDEDLDPDGFDILFNVGES